MQLQLNPHFIFNTLQTVDLEILKSQPPGNASSFLIHNLSDILKYSLENTSRLVPLKEEIAVCKKYAEIQKLRYTNPFLLYWEYEEEVLEIPIIHLVLQPLLENSLHHAIKELPRQGLIKIKLFIQNKRLHFYVVDNGLGISKDRLVEINSRLKRQNLTQNSHIGLYNTNMRLVLTYRAVSTDPSLVNYYPELLAVVFLTLGFYRLSSFAFRSGRTRRFALYAVLAIAFCLATLADLPDTARLLFYLGGALTLFGFLLQRSAVPAAPWDNL